MKGRNLKLTGVILWESFKPLLHVETFSWKLCATALRNMPAGVAPCNRVGFVKLFEHPLRDKFHEK